MKIFKKLKNKFDKLSRKQKIALALFLALLMAAGAYAISQAMKKDPQPVENKKYYSLLTGEELSQDDSELPILAVMIENSNEARPQAGLDNAGMVFETVTEGGITRFVALYQQDLPKRLGPVRSVRPPFVSWLFGLDASVAHVGGSAEALALIDRLKAKSLTQFTYPEPYERVNDKAAPHNVYANPKKLRDLQDELKHQQSTAPQFTRSDDAPAVEPEKPTAPKITLDFSSPEFAAEFRYNAESNSYDRFLAGTPHVDELTNKPINVKNVIVLKLRGTDSNSLKAVGKGEAFLFKDGKVQKINWEKPDHKSRLKLVDETGNEVSLNRGDSWVAALPQGRSPSY